jgi:signal transduction histidine kinase
MTLRVRLAIFIALVIAGALISQGVLGYLNYQRTIQADVNHDLSQYLDQLAAKIKPGQTDFSSFEWSYENYVTRARLVRGLVRGADQVIAFSGAFPDSQSALMPLQATGGWQVAVRELPTYDAIIPAPGTGVRLEVALSTLEYDIGLDTYRQTILFTTGLLATLGVLSALGLSARALRPLHVLIATAQKVSQLGDLSARVSLAGVRGELAQLGLAFNTMLERLQGFRQREIEFTRHAAHELRTPLGAMRMQLSMHEAGLANHTETIEVMTEEVLRMIHLSESLLLLSREGQVERQRFDLTRLAEHLAFKYGAKYHGPDQVTVRGNATLIGRALENLLENAAKYAPGNETILALEHRHGFVVLSVMDKGSGMQPEVLEQATQAFYRAPGTQSPGNGLGLAIVKRICETHDGHVTLENLRPCGLRVSLHLKLGSESV